MTARLASTAPMQRGLSVLECDSCDEREGLWTVDGEVACLHHAVQIAADHFSAKLETADLVTLVNLRDVLDGARANVETEIKRRVTTQRRAS